MHNGRLLSQLCACTEGVECLIHGLELRRGFFLSFSLSDTPHYPYLLPKGWEWCKLEDIVSFGGGKTPSMDNKEYWDNGKHLWVTSKDMKCSHITNSLLKITEKALEGMTLYAKGTLLVVTRSGILRHTLPLSILEKPATVNQDLKTISPHIQELSEYLYVIIKANEHIILKEYHKDGTTVDSIDFDKFRCLPIPLAPIAEQKRIIETAKNWFSLIDQIEQGKADLQTIIKQTKSKILDLAIHGKLVPQDPNDEPAIELLKRINPDFTPCDNGHRRKLPQGWAYCQLSNVFKITMGQSPKGDSLNNKRGIEFHQGKICFSDKFLLESGIFTNEPTKIAEPNSILLCVRAPVGVVNITNNQICIGRGLCALTPFEGNADFYFYLLQTLQYSFDNQSTGTTFKAISGEIIKNENIILPPLAEQQRIVQKIEELFHVLDNIQNALEV